MIAISQGQVEMSINILLLHTHAIHIQYWTGIKMDIDLWNRIKSPQINPCIYDQLILDKEVNDTQKGK